MKNNLIKTNDMKETEQKINYSFIALPTNFIFILDGYCLKVFCLLLDKHNYWVNLNQLDEQGYFRKSLTEISNELEIKNRMDVRLTIQALIDANIIDFKDGEHKNDAPLFKLNFDKIQELNQAKDLRISKLSRKPSSTVTDCNSNITSTVTDCNSKLEEKQELMLQNVSSAVTDCNTTIYYTLNKNINLNKIYYLYNINNLNKYNKINNFIEYINKEKNNNKLLEEKKVEVTVTNVTDITDNSNNENNTPNENNKNMNRLNEKIKESLVKMNEIKSIDELNKKIILFQEWFNKKYEKDNSIDKELFQKELINKSNEIFERLYSNDERKFNVAEVGIKLVQFKKKLIQLKTISNDEKNDIINFINSNISFIYFMESSSDLLKITKEIFSKLEQIQVMEYEPITQNAK